MLSLLSRDRGRSAQALRKSAIGERLLEYRRQSCLFFATPDTKPSPALSSQQHVTPSSIQVAAFLRGIQESGWRLATGALQLEGGGRPPACRLCALHSALPARRHVLSCGGRQKADLTGSAQQPRRYRVSLLPAVRHGVRVERQAA